LIYFGIFKREAGLRRKPPSSSVRRNPVSVEDAQTGYEMMRTLYDKKIYPNAEGLRNVVRLLGRTSEQIRKIKVEEIIDDRVVRKLEKEGLF
jgi:hypothetical protein